MSFSMMGGMFSSIKQVFMEIFNFIPKLIYLLYASIACVIDVLQLFFRKVVGLDVFWVDGQMFEGDLVTHFIGDILGFTDMGFTYSTLTTTFYSFVLFGVIMVFITVFVQIIKSHYTYDEKSAKGPMQHVYAGAKALLNIVVVPVVVYLGLFLSQAILEALDTMTSINSGTVVAVYGDKVNMLRTCKTKRGDETYIFYDVLGYGTQITYGGTTRKQSEETLALIASKTATFSGQLFSLAAYNGNRARTGEMDPQGGAFYTGKEGSNMDLFANAQTDKELSVMIDTAFQCTLVLDHDSYYLEYGGSVDKIKYIKAFRTLNFNTFSKFNVGLVWYYYDLWQFNFIVGFGAIIICANLFINIIFGLITRMFMCVGLFVIYPPLFGLAPLDGGKASKSWREEFVKNALMGYGSVVGMNLFFIMLPYFNEIDFTNIEIVDMLIQSLIILVGLMTIKAFISMISGFIGGGDAQKTGADMAGELGAVAGKATKATVGFAKGAWNAPKNIVGGVKKGAAAVGKGAKAVGKAGKAVGHGVAAAWNTGKAGVNAVKKGAAHVGVKHEAKARRDIKAEEKKQKDKNKFMAGFGSKSANDIMSMGSKAIEQDAISAGMSKREAKTLAKSITTAAYNQQAGGGGSSNMDVGKIKDMQRAFDSTYDKNYNRDFKKEYREHTGAMLKHGREKASAGLKMNTAWNSKKSHQASAKRAGGEMKTAFGEFKAVGSQAVSKLSEGLLVKQTSDVLKTAVKGNKGVDEFLDKSGIAPKPDYAKMTAENTAKIAENTKKP